MSQVSEYLLVKEAAKELGVSKVKMAYIIASGLLATRSSLLDRRVKLIARSDIEQLKTQPRRTAVPQTLAG